MLAIFLIANMYEFFDSLTKQNTVSIYPKIPPNSTNSNNLVAYIEQIYSICYFKDTPTICKFEKSTGQILSPTKFGSENPILTVSGPYDVITMTHENRFRLTISHV